MEDVERDTVWAAAIPSCILDKLHVNSVQMHAVMRGDNNELQASYDVASQVSKCHRADGQTRFAERDCPRRICLASAKRLAVESELAAWSVGA